MSTILAVLNPGSGSAKPDAVRAELESRLGGVAVLEAPEGVDLVAFIREALTSHRPDVLIVSGGDGTVSAGATALGGRRIPLAILPSGTANVFATETGCPASVDELVEAIEGGGTRACDVGDLAGRRMICRLGIGTFGEVGPNTSPQAKKVLGPLSYAWAALPFIAEAPLFDFDLDLDGTQVRASGSSVIITNLGSVGFGNLRWGPTVVPDDGALDVFVIHSQHVGDNLEVLWNALGGDTTECPQISHRRVERYVDVRMPEPTAAVLDGEAIREAHYRITVQPGALDLVRARGSA